MCVYDNHRPGDRVTWTAINGVQQGTVLSVDGRGVLVACDGGAHALLTSTESYKNFINKEHQRNESREI